MRGRKRGIGGRVSVALSVSALVVVMVLLLSGAALAAPPWSDAPNSWWVSTYQLTDQEIGTVGEGYPDGTFRPQLDVTREQFAKMVVDGMGLPTATPPVPTFKDVPVSNYFYPWIEGGAAARIISGFTDGSFGPKNNIVRQQANSILGSYLAQKELNLRSHIAGSLANYPTLNTWYLAEGMAVLAAFADSNRVATVHGPATAYLIFRGVVQGSYSNGAMYLGPNNNLTRAQAAALIMRVKAMQFSTTLPTVTSLTPSSGPAAGGNNVVIAGTNFTDVISVMFGSTSVGFTVNSSTQITVKAPAGMTGTTVDVVVTTAAGSSTPGVASKYVYGVPSVTGIDPASGPAAGGNTVIITGVNLTGATAVRFGTKNAISFTVDSSTRITAKVPSGTAGTMVDVTVVTGGGTTAISNATKYSYGAPTVTSLTPASGPAVGGNTVVITGIGFTGVTAVKFGTKAAISYVVNSPTSISAVAPSGTSGTTVDVTVTTGGGTSVATAASKYSYGIPVVTAINPKAGPITGGTVVVITGTGFTGVTGVTFGTQAATSFVVNSSTQITAVAPSGTGTVDVRVITAGGTSATSADTKFTYGIPTIIALSPNTGATTGGTAVTITGTGFTTPAAVTFGTGYPATNVVVVNSTTITCVAPAHPLGVVDVVVTTMSGSSSPAGTANDFTYVVPAATPSAIHLTPGTLLPVGSVVDVAIPLAGGTDSTGKVLGWVANTACNIKFTVTDSGIAHSTITINGYPYISGQDYKIWTAASLTIVVTTSEVGKAAVTRTFLVSVAGPVASAPAAIHLGVGATDGVGGVMDVTDPGPGGTNTTGAVTGWVANTASDITFTVTDTAPATSQIRINGVLYTSGTDYKILAASPLTIVVTTTETGRAAVTRTFIVSVTQVQAGAPSLIQLAQGATFPVGGVVPVGPLPMGGTDSTGKVTGWAADTAYNIKFTVTDVVGASSQIRINGVLYTSGTDYKILAASPLSIVVTTTEAGKATVVRTYNVSVTQAQATAPSLIQLATGTSLPVASVVDVGPLPNGGADNTGKVLGWVAGTACNIKFTVTDVVGASSQITINGLPYMSAADYTVPSLLPLSIVVTTSQPGYASVVRTYTVTVSPTPAAAPTLITLQQGDTLPVGGVTDVGALPDTGGTDNTGAVTGWVAATACNIKFTVTDAPGATSTITINTAPYLSGHDITIPSASSLAIVVTTTQPGRATVVRTYNVTVTP